MLLSIRRNDTWTSSTSLISHQNQPSKEITLPKPKTSSLSQGLQLESIALLRKSLNVSVQHSETDILKRLRF